MIVTGLVGLSMVRCGGKLQIGSTKNTATGIPRPHQNVLNLDSGNEPLSAEHNSLEMAMWIWQTVKIYGICHTH